LTLHEAAWHHYTAAWATLNTTARRRAERVRDYAAFRQSAVTDAPTSGMRAVVLEQDGQGRADSLVARLMANGITVKRLGVETPVADAILYGGASGSARVAAGSYVVDLAQPAGRLARALLEPDAQLDSSFIREELEGRRTNQPSRFYDVTAWSLPHTFRVRAWGTRTMPTGEELRSDYFAPRRAILPSPTGSPPVAWVFEPGSEASTRLLAALLADSIKVWYAPRSFRAGGSRFPNGAFVIRVAPNGINSFARVNRAVGSTGAKVTVLTSMLVDEGTDLGSNSVIPIRSPSVALVGGAPIQGNSFGFAWYAFDQRIGLPVTTIAAASISNALLESFNVLVVPSVGTAAFDATLGDAGRAALGTWVRNGGVLVTLDGASGWVANERVGLVRLRLRRDTTRADSSGGAPLAASVPGAILRAHGDTLSPLLAGVRGADIPVLMFSDRVFATPRDLRAGEAAIRYAPEARLRLAGYLWPEVPARVAGSPYLWTERVGRGRVIAFAGDPNFRDMWRGLLPIFANAVLLGGSF
ncbi:MAG: hypothetical protein ACRENU_08390, partial [Gemmatimonadaceae bacterium]